MEQELIGGGPAGRGGPQALRRPRQGLRGVALDAQPAPRRPPRAIPCAPWPTRTGPWRRSWPRPGAVLDHVRNEPGHRDWAADRARLASLAGSLAQIEKHYLKKENQLFPRLEAKGVSGPSKVMWAVHDDIRAHLKEFRRVVDIGDAALVLNTGAWVLQEISDMIGKEEKVLFPMCLEMLDDADWARVKTGEEEIGYAWIAPGPGLARRPRRPPGGPGGRTRARISSSTPGVLTAEQIDLMLTHLPVDISFVDENDTVRYYSATAERIFPRTPGVIGRKVQNCHPPKSLDVVERILEAFRSGRARRGRILDRIAGPVHPHPLLRDERQAGRLPGRARGHPGRDRHPGAPRREALARWGQGRRTGLSRPGRRA
ncbi:MAG: PAS domain-containing protein [Candidatus Moduliflexus flocculans]|nr:PAS domain-containing protein [Candidatus Moduliflexus flocculans]